ncbi:MAG: hypothetical protein ABSG19_13585 [Candidatus Aminicenantales bacterium]
MKKAILTAGLVLALLAGPGLALSQAKPAPAPDKTKVLGTWSLDVFAGGMTITLSLLLEEAEGQLAGKISEANGMFSDAPLTNIEYDGERLAYDISIPSPPDGAVKAWRTELKVGEDVVEGSIANTEAGMSATISGKRVKK